MDQNAPDCSLSGAPPYHCEGCNLSGMILAGKDLRGANLKNTTSLGTIFKGVLSMDGADLSGATMGEGTDFSGCDLTKTVFDASPQFGSNPAKPTIFRAATMPYHILGSTWQALDLAQAIIADMPAKIESFRVIQCDVSGIDFSKKLLKNAHFASVVAHKTIFSGATLDNIVFGRNTSEPTDLTGARFEGASISSGVFDTATLTGADFRNAKPLSQATFLSARMDGTKFDNTDLTTCSFSSLPWWSKEPGHNTSFKGATLNYRTIGKQWSFLDLTDATLVGLDHGVDLTYLQALYAVLIGVDLSGYVLDHSDFTGATLAGTKFVGAHMDRATLRGVNGEKPVFDGAWLTLARFDRNGGQTHSRLHGASFKGAKLQHADVSYADFGPAGKDPSDFTEAVMDNLTAVHADFTGANLSGGISMHGASFADATLANTNMAGAVLGALNNFFTIKTSESDYEVFLNRLNAADVAGVAAIFEKRGDVQLEPVTTIQVTVAGKAWQVKDGQLTYTVLLVTASDGTKSLQVFQPSTAGYAVLSGAFMPDAILNDANLIRVQADRIQLFRTSAANQLASAIMYGIDLSNSILGSEVPIDISEAILIEAHMSGAFLINANLKNSHLEGANFSEAQLQGADFSDATLTNANLTDAVVSILILDDGISKYYGVHLFEVLEETELFHDALAELALFTSLGGDDGPRYPCGLATDTDGGDGGYANLLADLNGGKLNRVRAAFTDRLGVALSTQTTVDNKSDALGSAWLLRDPQGRDYTVWIGLDPLTVGQHWIYAQPNVPTLRKLFNIGYDVRLCWPATISPVDAKAWVIDNDSENPSNLQTGYVTFLVTQQSNTLAVFGTSIHATRLESTGQQEMGVFGFSGTVLCKNPPCNPRDTYLQSDTFCPNGETLSANLQEHKPWAEMMQSNSRPPLPPTCVPSPYAPCPQTAAVPREKARPEGLTP
jgi:uncharacterized protein YjbI with pentapeptide repeats